MVVLNGVLPFFLILVGLVIAHELGHFVVAKLAGVRVEEFGVGMPPRLWGFRIGETLYSINLLPLGGFVKLTGEESAQLSVRDVNAHSPAHEAGVREGDVILSVNEAAVHDEEQLAAHLRRAEPEGPIALVIQRSQSSEDGKGTELVDYDLVLAGRPIDAPEVPPLMERGDESDAAAIGRLAGVQVRSDERSLGSEVAAGPDRRDGGRSGSERGPSDRVIRFGGAEPARHRGGPRRDRLRHSGRPRC